MAHKTKDKQINRFDRSNGTNPALFQCCVWRWGPSGAHLGPTAVTGRSTYRPDGEAVAGRSCGKPRSIDLCDRASDHVDEMESIQSESRMTETCRLGTHQSNRGRIGGLLLPAELSPELLQLSRSLASSSESLAGPMLWDAGRAACDRNRPCDSCHVVGHRPSSIFCCQSFFVVALRRLGAPIDPSPVFFEVGCARPVSRTGPWQDCRRPIDTDGGRV
jgi:hypothetical protein